MTNRRTVKIRNKLGLHARAAAKLVSTASAFESRILLHYNGQDADAKSIMAIMMLAATLDTDLEVSATGSDADQALDALVALVDNRFGEDE